MEEELLKSDRNNFNRYVFLSTLSRSLIETFIGSLLIKSGFDLKAVIFYYLLVNIFSFILAFPCIFISKKYTNKILPIIGIISFIILQVLLNTVQLNEWYLLLIAFLFALYRRCYWISRRYYTLYVIDKKDVAKQFSLISFLNQAAIIFASYAGALLLEYVSMGAITIISTLLIILSIYFVLKIRAKEEKNNTRIDILETISCTPISTIIHIGCFELQNVISFLLPLYILIYVKDTYTAVGIVNLTAQLATLLFIILYGKIISKEKNYLLLSTLLIVVTKLLQVNTYGIMLFIFTFINGLSSKMYEQSFNKELLLFSKKYEFHNFNLLYECIQNFFRVIAVGIFFIFINDIKVMMYISLGIVFITVFFKFKTTVTKTNSPVLWKE